MSAFRARLSYANVVSTLALVVAASGTAVAANHYIITSPKQVKPGVLTAKNFNKKALKKLHGPIGKTGPAGAAGAAGATGAAGAAGAPGTAGAPGPTLAWWHGSGPSATANIPDSSTAATIDATPPVPAGSYLVTATASIQASSGKVLCQLSAASEDSTPVELSFTASGVKQLYAEQWVAIIANPTPIQLRCLGSATGGTASSQGGSISAVPYTTLTAAAS